MLIFFFSKVVKNSSFRLKRLIDIYRSLCINWRLLIDRKYNFSKFRTLGTHFKLNLEILISNSYNGGMEDLFSLVHPFNSRWRWCCGVCNFRLRILKLGYRRPLFSQDFFHSLGFDFITYRLITTKYLLRFHGIFRLVSRHLCRRYIIYYISPKPYLFTKKLPSKLLITLGPY